MGRIKAGLKDDVAISKLNPYHVSVLLNGGVINMRGGRMRSAIDDFRVCERDVHAV